MRAIQDKADLWVFAYGSLMWRPGFDYEERTGATIRGYHRALCIRSYFHRGTPERPGLVLGLDRGGSCRGIAYRVAGEMRAETIAYLREREQVTDVYLEVVTSALLPDGRVVAALTYRADRKHPQYAGALPDEDVLRIIQEGVGMSGANPDYVLATQDHLVELGIHDALLTRLAARLRGP